MDQFDVIVIGGGIAGTAAAHFLAKRSLRVKIFEEGPGLSSGASGNPDALLTPYITNSPSEVEDFYASAFGFASQILADLKEKDLLKTYRKCGAIQLPSTPRMRALTEQFSNGGRIHKEGKFLNADDASEISGIKLNHNALLYPNAICVSPVEFCASLVSSLNEKISISTDSKILSIKWDGSSWNVQTKNEKLIAKYLVVANAFDVTYFTETNWLQVEKIRGQLTLIESSPELKSLMTAICFDGYVLPAREGFQMLGASFDHGWFDPEVNVEKDIEMARRLTKWAELKLPIKIHHERSRVSFRTSTHDRIPYIGAVSNYEEVKNSKIRWSDIEIFDVPTHPNLYVSSGHGSRGLLSATLGGEIIARKICKESLEELTSAGQFVNPDRLIKRLIKREAL